MKILRDDLEIMLDTKIKYEALRMAALRLLAIVKRAANNSCCACCDNCLACDARDLLESIGEEK